MIKILITGILLAIAAVSGNVSKALSSGDAELLGSQFNETVDLTILDDEGVYSNTQAKQIPIDSKESELLTMARWAQTRRLAGLRVVGSLIRGRSRPWPPVALC